MKFAWPLAANGRVRSCVSCFFLTSPFDFLTFLVLLITFGGSTSQLPSFEIRISVFLFPYSLIRRWVASAPFPWGGQAAKIGPLTSPCRLLAVTPKSVKGPGGSPREPSRARRGPQGSLRGPKGSPREPWRSRNGPQGSLRGPKGSRREPLRIRKGHQRSFNIENT